MRPAARPSAVEYFAYITFGQKLGMTFDLLRQHIFIFLDLSLLFGTVMMILLIIIAAVSGLGASDLSAALNPFYDKFKKPSLTLLVGFVGLMTLYYYIYLGFHTLALQYINRKRPPVFGIIFSPVTDRPGGIALSFLLWVLLGLAALGGGVLAALLINALISDRSVQFFIFCCVFVTVFVIFAAAAQCASFYIGDCLGRGRRFRVLETISKPIRLIRLNFWPYMGAAIFAELLYFLPPTLLDMAAEALQSGSGRSKEGLGLILLVFVLSIVWQILAFIFGIFFMGLTYKQAKARFLLQAQGQIKGD